MEQLTSAEYWVNHARNTVRFADAVDWLHGHGAATFLELGPDGVLSAMAQNSLAATGTADGASDSADAVLADGIPATLAVLRPGRPEVETLTAALAGLHTRGAAVQWELYFQGTGAQRTALPTYAFQRRRYWPKSLPATGGDVRAAGLGAAHHPLLTAAVSVANSDGLLLTGRLSRRTHPWLADHAVRGTVLLPGTAFLELAVRAGDEAGCGRVEELTLAAPLLLPEEGGVQVQVWVGSPDESGRRAVSVHSRPDGPEELPWTQHASGTLVAGEHHADFDATAWPPADAQPLDLDGFYDRMADTGFGYGPLFQGLHAAWRSGDDVYAEVTLPDTNGSDADSAASFGIHPALLDAALHAAAFADLGEHARGGLPFSWQDVTLHASGATTVRVKLTPAGDDAVAIAVADTTGAAVASIGSLVLRPVPDERFGAANSLVREALFELRWTAPHQSPQTAPASVGVLGPDLFGLERALSSPDLTVMALPGADGTRAPDVVLAPSRVRTPTPVTRSSPPCTPAPPTSWHACGAGWTASSTPGPGWSSSRVAPSPPTPDRRRTRWPPPSGAWCASRRANTPAVSACWTSTPLSTSPPRSRCCGPWPWTSRRPPSAAPPCSPRGSPVPRHRRPLRNGPLRAP